MRKSMIPDLCGAYTDRDWSRYHHLDLAEARTEDLQEELWALRPILFATRQESYSLLVGRYEARRRLAWLRERVARIQSTLSARRHARAVAQPSPKPQGVRV